MIDLGLIGFEEAPLLTFLANNFKDIDIKFHIDRELHMERSLFQFHNGF
jgi:hypothetical protein